MTIVPSLECIVMQNFPSLTLPLHNVMEGRHVCTPVGSTSVSWRIQSVTHCGGMRRQNMLPNILRSCNFDTIAGPTQLPIQWVPQFSPRGNATKREVGPSPTPSAEGETGCNYTSTLFCSFTECTGQVTFTFKPLYLNSRAKNCKRNKKFLF